MPLQVVDFSLIGFICSQCLLVQALHLRRQQAVQAELAPLALCKRGASVPVWTVEEMGAREDVGSSRLAGSMLCGHFRLPFFFSRLQFILTRVENRMPSPWLF